MDGGRRRSSLQNVLDLRCPSFYVYEVAFPKHRRLDIRQNKWSTPECQVWPCNLFLSKFLEMYGEKEGLRHFKGKQLVELCAGCGLPSMVAALLGFDLVVATEYSTLLPLLSNNVDSFKTEFSEQKILCKKLSLLNEDAIFDQEVDYIICSDVFHNWTLRRELPSFLAKLLKPRTVLIMAHTMHSDGREKCFFDVLKGIFEVQEVADEDEIRAYTSDSCTKGASLLRSQGTQDIQETCDKDGHIVIFRITFPRREEFASCLDQKISDMTEMIQNIENNVIMKAAESQDDEKDIGEGRAKSLDSRVDHEKEPNTETDPKTDDTKGETSPLDKKNVGEKSEAGKRSVQSEPRRGSTGKNEASEGTRRLTNEIRKGSVPTSRRTSNTAPERADRKTSINK